MWILFDTTGFMPVVIQLQPTGCPFLLRRAVEPRGMQSLGQVEGNHHRRKADDK